MNDAVLPLITLVIGYVGSLLTEWARDRRAATREDRRSSAEFRRSALLQLQDEIEELISVLGHAIANDGLAPMLRGTPPSRRPAGVIAFSITKLAARLNDEDLDRRVTRMIELENACLRGDWAERSKAFETLAERALAVNRSVGRMLNS